MVRALTAALALLPALLLAAPAGAAELRVVGWNTESGDAEQGVLAEGIAETEGVDLWGLSEVLPSWEAPFRGAAGSLEGRAFESVLGTTGGADRLLVLYDAERLEELARRELHHINFQRRVRSPLVVHLRERDSGLEFLFMVNHLYRSRAEQRHEQSRALREWASQQTLPIIAVGDYNYDWHFEGGDLEHDVGYDELTRDDLLVWVRPERLVPTHCGFRQNVLDFVFAGGEARDWQPRSTILRAQPDYCPDDALGSDHRPVLARFDLSRGRWLLVRREALARIGRLEEELHGLRDLVERID